MDNNLKGIFQLGKGDGRTLRLFHSPYSLRLGQTGRWLYLHLFHIGLSLRLR